METPVQGATTAPDGDPPDEPEQAPVLQKAVEAEVVTEAVERPAETEPERGESRWTRLAVPLIVGVIMFVLGLGAGYFGRPIVSPQPTPSTGKQTIQTMLVSWTRHFKGNPNAPVTMLEFSDFQ